MRDVLLGATAVACFTIALFFVRFYFDSRDRFHLLFAWAFVLFGAQRLALATVEVPSEVSPVFYVPRLAGYALIILAVVGKNLGRPRRREDV